VCIAVGFACALISPKLVLSQEIPRLSGNRVRTEMPYRDGVVILSSDTQEQLDKDRYRAQGHVEITYKDIVISSDAAEYNRETQQGLMTGKIRFSQKELWLVCSRAELNFRTETGVFYDASGYTDKQFFVTGRTIHKTGPESYRVESSTATTCAQELPKWIFTASRTDINNSRTAHMRNMVFKIKNVPVFYAPYLIVPMEKKERSSGFVPFHTGQSTSKGRVISEGYYQTLGRSADLTVYGDYFSRRGLAVGGIFRARPSEDTRFELETYGINDRQDQGGIQLNVNGESLLKDDWRAVARVNISSNFSFRQAFAESFRSATVSQERAIAFLSRNHNSFSINVAYDREEVIFPERSLVITKIPSVEFHSLGTPLGKSPFIFSLRTSLDGISRVDRIFETQHLVQRLDVYPSMSVRIPAIAGFSIMPSVGVRETYYGAQLSDTAPTGILNQSLNRQYADLNIDMRTPILEKDFSSSWFGDFTHSVEPFAIYRRTYGIDEFDKIIRFDEQDPIADTNEIEYGIINRFFRKGSGVKGVQGNQEFMSLGLIQKYYFDPSFGGAFETGRPNDFRPLDTVTGFYQMVAPRDFAPLSAILRLSPKTGIHNDVRADFDVKSGRWRSGSLTTLWQLEKFFLAGTYYQTRFADLGIVTRNHVQGQIGFGSPARGFSSTFAVSYNLQTAQFLNSTANLSYTWDCCGLTAAYSQFDLGQRTETRFSFSFMLKGLGRFGNVKRPESLF
jgi:LPS-assembly protein